MVDITVEVLTPPDEIGFISLDDAKIMLGIPGGDISQDAQLEMLIDQNSAVLADMLNHYAPGLGVAKQKVREIWSCVSPVCCPDGTCRVYLLLYPIKKPDIESVESPAGTILDASAYRLEEITGKLTLLNGCSSEIIVTYTGGWDLPEEAPLPLQQATGLMVRSFRTQAAQESTGGAGIRMIAHKESRVMYFSPKDMAGGGTTTTSPSLSGAQNAVNSLIAPYQRLWI